jgi:hypothetical protein
MRQLARCVPGIPNWPFRGGRSQRDFVLSLGGPKSHSVPAQNTVLTGIEPIQPNHDATAKAIPSKNITAAILLPQI